MGKKPPRIINYLRTTELVQYSYYSSRDVSNLFTDNSKENLVLHSTIQLRIPKVTFKEQLKLQINKIPDMEITLLLGNVSLRGQKTLTNYNKHISLTAEY